MTTIFEALREDHDVQRQLLELVEKTQGDSQGRNELFAKLKVELSAHAAAEERAFYAHLMADAMTTEIARHSVAEHKELDDRIAELDDTSMSSSAWLTKFRELAHRVLHHLEEEEQQVFQMGGKVLSDAQKTELVKQFRTEKAAEAT